MKDTSKIRLCVDYRKLNLFIPQVQYLMPSLDDILIKAGDAQVMSKLDLSKGFYCKKSQKTRLHFMKYRFNACPLD